MRLIDELEVKTAAPASSAASAPPIHLINLDRDADRLEGMRVQFERLGLRFSRVPGVDGRNLTAEQIAYHQANPRRARLGAAEVGCILSHRECWLRIAEGPDPYGAVFEDDVDLSPDAAAFLASAAWIQGAPDIVKLETISTPVKIAGEPAFSHAGRDFTRLVNLHAGAAGYILSRAAAGKLLANADIIEKNFDVFVFDPRIAKPFPLLILQAEPALCIQERFRASGRDSPTFASDLETDRQTREDARAGNPYRWFRQVLRPRLGDLPVRLKALAFRPFGLRYGVVEYR